MKPLSFFRLAADRRAVTLIEMIVVMGIIIFLAAAIGGASYALMKHGQVKNTENLLTQLGDALNQFHTDHRTYVQHDNSTALFKDWTEADLIASSGALWYALEQEGHYVEVAGENRLKDKVAHDDASDKDITFFYYCDAWKRPLAYRCMDPYHAYELRSAGPDRAFNTTDDIIKRNTE